MDTELVHLTSRDDRPFESDGVVALTSIAVVDFAVVVPKPKPLKVPVASAETSVQTTWGPVIVTALLTAVLTAVLSFLIQSHFRSSDKAATASDEHINQLIQTATGSKFDAINSRLMDIAGKVEHVQGQVEEMNDRTKKIAAEQDGLRKRVDGQEAIARLQDPSRILGAMTGEIEYAEKKNQPLPPAQLADYRNALLEWSNYKFSSADSQLKYWRTVAAIINYQSHVNQLSGAPDPAKVSRACPGLTAGHGSNNIFENMPISNCILDLDTTQDVLSGVVVRNSVVRYHGGPVTLHDVLFVNCTFILDLPSKTAPVQPAIFLTILNSRDEKEVRISTPS